MGPSSTARTRGRPKDAMAPEERRRQVLEAAMAAIRDGGAATSMEAIATAAGVTKPVVYTHFGDKAGLTSAIAEHVGDALAADVATALDPTVDPYEQLRAAIGVFVRWVQTDAPVFNYLQASNAGGDTHHDVLVITGRIAGAVRPAIELLLRTLERDTGPASTYAHGIVGFVYLGVEEWLARPVEGDADADATELIETLCRFTWAGLVGSGD